MEKAKGLEVVLQYFEDFTPAQIQQLSALGGLYTEWNAKINVISRKDIDALYEKHVLHSLSIAVPFTFTPGMEVIDIGTGGGFPGIPLAILFPETRFHLVDSIGKKIKVVDAIREAIGLTNVTTQHIRAEEIKDRKFDVAVSRAVAPLKELHAWSQPLLRKRKRTDPTQFHSGPLFATIPSGLICLKGGDLSAEISESNTRPRMVEIYDLFPLNEFREKYLLNVRF
ncbi:16S rRNA (guanine(527)-N(7))-methyltransferase RsmG [Puia sp.]|jgi:16S rRNA (guanine527-N7)-methyltransferase|uniref:16S rRNA (guanine(527)-N(7))-methyltransferase RsmG n=1 Tax=Puia sp. TaxID=2045100 RepID=UPI002F42BC3E